MISLHSFLIYVGIYSVAVVIPGPGIVSIVARALGSGFRATLPAIAGTTLGDITLMTLSAFGLTLVAQAMGEFFLAVKLAGAAYLLYLAYKYWTAPVEAGEVIPASARKGFLAQYALTIGNPKAIAFFVALLPMAVDLKTLNAVGYAQLCGASLVVIPVITMTYAALASRARNFLTSQKARKRMNKGAAAIMACAGVGVVVS
jgi:threonine/homoserine/homoserine lactone efflux protein